MKMNLFKPRKNVCWPDVYFAAEAAEEDFEDVTVVTLKSHLVEKAYELALKDFNDRADNDAVLRSKVCTILNAELFCESPHVDVSPSGISVVVDCEAVDDDVMWAALDMVASALKKLEGTFGIVTFGPSISYSAAEIPWMIPH